MKNNRIVRAYDSINPSLTDKQRMLDNILQEANLEEKPGKKHQKRQSRVYTAKAPMGRSRTPWGIIAASTVMLLISGAVLVRFVGGQEMQPSYADPTQAVTEIYEMTAQDHYAPVLKKYNQAIAEGWSKEQCEIEGISPRGQAGFDVTKAGYAFLDLDGDGREELIIAEESTARTDNIWDLYTTLEDGTPIQLWVDELEGGQCKLCEDNVISISYSSKDELEQTFCKLEEGQLAMLGMLQWEDEDTVFHTDAEGNTRQITSRQGQAISYAYESQKLTLTWLGSTQDTDALERYTPMLEKYRTALTESWTLEQCQKNDISPNILYTTSITNELGWCLLDIDKNGIEELIISDGTHLIDLYTIMPTDDAPSHLISAYPDSYVLCRNGRIQKQEVSSAAGPTYWRWYTLSGIDLMLQRVLYCENNQYSYGTSEDDLQPISKDEAGNFIVGSSAMPLALTPFAENESISSDAEKSYGRTLSTYRQAIAHDWNPGQCAENGISLMVGYYGDFVNDLGYAMMDLDSNGIDELIITDGINIYDMYTLFIQEPVHIISASERITYNLKAGNVIYNRGSGGAATTLHVFYRVEDDKLMVQEAYIYDAYLYPDSPWFFSDGENYGDPCGDFDAQAAIDAHKTVHIPFTPFE